MMAIVESDTEFRRALQPRSILIVEDNADDFVLARHEIRKLKITNPVQRIPDPRELINYISGSGPYGDRSEFPIPAVILLDLRLPGTNGLEIQAALRSNLRFRDVPIIAISSNEQLTTLRTCVTLGATAYMVKPFSAKQFARVLLNNQISLETYDENFSA